MENQTQAHERLIQENSRSIQENSRSIQQNGEYIRELAANTRQNIDTLVAEIAKLTVDQRDKFNRFYGYHQAADSDRLNLFERIIKVEQEIAQIKQKLDN